MNEIKKPSPPKVATVIVKFPDGGNWDIFDVFAGGSCVLRDGAYVIDHGPGMPESTYSLHHVRSCKMTPVSDADRIAEEYQDAVSQWMNAVRQAEKAEAEAARRERLADRNR